MDTSRSSLSFSRGWTFNACQKQYDYKYVQWLKPMARDVNIDKWEQFTRGSVIHSGIEGGFLKLGVDKYIDDSVAGIRANEELSAEQKMLLEDIQNDSKQVVAEFLEWLPVSDWEPVTIKGAPGVEIELTMPLPGWKGWLGYADLVAKHLPTGRILVLDWKTRKQFENEDADRFNSQFPVYQRAINLLGIDCAGSLLVEIKPEPPKRAPRTTRDDVGSINSPRISTDGRFRTIPTFRSKQFIEAVWNDTVRLADAMRAFDPSKAYRSMSKFNCGGCFYQKLCMAEANGEDVADVLATSYTKSSYTPRKPAASLNVII